MVFVFLAAAGGRLFWTANLSLVGEAFEGPERSRWFAFQRAARNGGYGLGGLLAAAALGLGSGVGYRALALANALSFVAAALLVVRWRRKAQGTRGPQGPQGARRAQRGSGGVVPPAKQVVPPAKQVPPASRAGASP